MVEQKLKSKVMYSERQTKSVVFILPMLEKSYSSYGGNFINCFIGDTSRPEYKEKIILLFNYKGTIEFSNFENYLRTINGYVTDYEPAKGYICFVYEIPDKFYMDYLRFIRGKYSQYSEELKKIITQGNTSGTNHKIFNKDAVLREHWESKIGVKLKETDEVFSIPNMDEEILDYDRHFKRGN